MVQTIATLIDETLMVMGAHLHVRMTDEEKAYLDAHFELIHIKKGIGAMQDLEIAQKRSSSAI